MKFFTSIISALAAAAVVSAAPTIETRDVWDPKLTYPHAGTVWYSGQRHNVTWETADQPVNITNASGFIALRVGNIETPVLLAHGFDVRAGRVEVTVPSVFSRDDYSLVLFGDSGNWGPAFTINGVDL